jgi:hypothetical protein
MFASVRARYTFRASRARTKPHLRLKIKQADKKEKTIRLSSKEYPHTLVLPVFGFPRLFMQNTDDVEFRATKLKKWGLSSDFNAKTAKLLQEHQGVGLHMPYRLRAAPFAKMLAKIAHCFMVGKLGIEGFRPLLTDVILKECAPISRFVGCVDFPLPLPATKPAPAHILGYELATWKQSANPVVVCLIKLFAFAPDSPVYGVVVGEGDARTEPRLRQSAWPGQT